MKPTNKLTRYTSPLSLFDRDEFVTPFDALYNQILKEAFPALSDSVGDGFFERGAYPKADIKDYGDKIVIEAEIPGLSKDDISIEIVDDALVLSCSKQEEVKEEKFDYIRRELRKSRTHRTFGLGDNVDKNDIVAEFKNGTLTITLKKVKPEEKKPDVKKIEIK